MRKIKLLLAAMLAVVVVGCVTINVYFPAAAAEQAAQKFIGDVIAPTDQPMPAPAGSNVAPPAAADTDGGTAMLLLDLLVPAAHAAQPDLQVSTPELQALRGKMRARYTKHLEALFDAGAIGLTRDGDVALRDSGSVPLSQRNQVRQWIEAENKDRAAVYREIAEANGHPEWTDKIRQTFAREWRNMAHSGWYYQDSAGDWKRK